MTKLKENTLVSTKEFHADMEHLSIMLQFICNQAKENGVPHEWVKKLELASEEALVNVINYAYEDKPNNIEIGYEPKKNSFSVHIIDSGKPFDPVDRAIDINKDSPIEKRKIGGLGIYLIRELMSEVTYYRNDDQNHLIITVRF